MIPQADKAWTIEEAAHLMNRAGFGATLPQITTMHAMGRHGAVDHLLKLHPDSNTESWPKWASEEMLREQVRSRFEAIREIRQSSSKLSEEEMERMRRNAIQKFQQQDRRNGLEAQVWWLTSMLKSPNPLQEKMTLFWHDHFATSAQKVKEPTYLMLQHRLFREHALGNFKALTHAVAKDAAMTLFLDMQTSRKGKPNENFARELMELFTLGQGNYTEEDIRQSARAFTGYSLDRRTRKVIHEKSQWDDGEKTFLGKTGRFNGDDIIDVIFEQEQASRYLSLKLWEFFAFENPPEAAIADLAKSLVVAKFELKPLLREIFLSKAFYAPECMANQIKSPVQFLVQSLKQLETPMVPPAYAFYVQSQLGQILFAPPNVAGWDWGKAWINTNTLFTRYQISGALTKGSKNQNSEIGDMGKMGTMKMENVKGFAGGGAGGLQNALQYNWKGPDYEAIVPRAARNDLPGLVDSLIDRFFQRKLPDKVRESFIAYAAEKKGVVFTNQEVAELIHLMMSTPHYQLC